MIMLAVHPSLLLRCCHTTLDQYIIRIDEQRSRGPGGSQARFVVSRAFLSQPALAFLAFDRNRVYHIMKKHLAILPTRTLLDSNR